MIMSMMASKSMRRVFGGLALFLLLLIFTIHLQYSQKEWSGWVGDRLETWSAEFPVENYTAFVKSSPASEIAISYNLLVPPKVGCEAVVNDLQLQLIDAYSKILKGVRHVNLWGYLETENKGDAAIWTGQQILLSMMGIESMRVCRFLYRGCNLEAFNSSLQLHRPHSAIIMAGGGNFNDYYWQDQPSRIAMIEAFPEIPIRGFPQSVHMTHHEHIQQTKDGFSGHPNLVVAARDQPSFNWLDENLGQKSLGKEREVSSILVPDIAFMWGNRPDFRLKTKKQYDIVIISRDDKEISAGSSFNLPFGTGTVDLGGSIGNVTYYRVDWTNTHTPGIDTYPHPPESKSQETGSQSSELNLAAYAPQESTELSTSPQNSTEPSTIAQDSTDSNTNSKRKAQPSTTAQESTGSSTNAQKLKMQRGFSTPPRTEYADKRENGYNQRAWAKATEGFELLASGKFVITDRLHAHIMSTLIGVPHVIMDSKLGKNLNFHDTWTQDCECTRVTTEFETSLKVARMYFESEKDTT